jgi:hypothetical protein
MHRQNSNRIQRCDAVSHNAIDFVTFERWEKDMEGMTNSLRVIEHEVLSVSVHVT